jgi:methyl-accepting chemotaxis protein
LAEIHKKAAEGQYATTEEYQKALDDCSAHYTEQLAYYGDEIDKAASNNSTIYENDYSNYEGWTVEKIRKTEEDTNAYITGAANKSAAEAGFITSVRDLLPDLEEAHIDATGYVSAMTTEIGSAEEGTGLLGTSRKSYEDYGAKIDGVMVAAGTSTETFKDKVSEYLLTGEDSVANRSDEARQKIEEMALAVTNLDKTIANVSAWQTSYSGEIQKAIDKTVEFMTTVNDMN